MLIKSQWVEDSERVHCKALLGVSVCAVGGTASLSDNYK